MDTNTTEQPSVVGTQTPQTIPSIPLPGISTDGSTILGVSIRGWIAMLVVFTVCWMSATKTAVVEPLYTLATVCISFYFGHQIGTNTQALKNQIK